LTSPNLSYKFLPGKIDTSANYCPLVVQIPADFRILSIAVSDLPLVIKSLSKTDRSATLLISAAMSPKLSPLKFFGKFMTFMA